MKIWEEFLSEAKDYLSSNTEYEIKMMHSKSALTRFANSHIHQNVDEESAEVYLTLHRNMKTTTISSNITAIKEVKSFIEKAEKSLENSPVDKGWAGLANKDNSYNNLTKIEESTPDERALKVKEFISSGSELNSAGYCSTSVDNFFVWNSNGLSSSDSSSSAFIDGIFRTENSAGSSHRGAKSLNELDSKKAGNEASKLAREGQNPEDINPGKYEVILGNEAVSTILVFLAVYGFNAKSKVDGMSPIVLNEQQFDEKITLLDTPEDFDSIGFKIDASGSKKNNLEIIKNGVSSNYFHTRRTSKELNAQNTFHELFGWGESFGGIGTNLKLKAGSKSLEEMISEVKNGIYINEFWYCRVLDPITQVVTGLNRNGSFLIENGKIIKPIGRLRFTQSFISSLSKGNVLGVGNNSRYADSEFGEGILNVPALHLKEFNFTGGVAG